MRNAPLGAKQIQNNHVNKNYVLVNEIRVHGDRNSIHENWISVHGNGTTTGDFLKEIKAEFTTFYEALLTSAYTMIRPRAVFQIF